MMEQQEIKLQTATKTLLSLAVSKKLLTYEQTKPYLKLSSQDAKTVFGITCGVFFKLGFNTLWKEHGDVMTALNEANPELVKFMNRTRYKLSVDSDKKFTRKEPVLFNNIKHLIEDAEKTKLITELQSSMYIDLIDWEAENYTLVEMDILKKYETWEYEKLKQDAPVVLTYIKYYYENWFDLITKPIINSLKK